MSSRDTWYSHSKEHWTGIPSTVDGMLGGYSYLSDLDLSSSARFRSAGVTNGLAGTELGVSYLLPRLIGASRAFEMILSGRVIESAEALESGLVSRVVPDEELLPAALALAEQITGWSAHGVAMTKKILWSNLEAGSLTNAIDCENRNQLLVRLTTENLAEAIRARREGRKPDYKD